MDSSDTKPVRMSEQLDWEVLGKYVRPKLATILGEPFPAEAPLTVEQFPGGHSNLTYLLRFGEQELVMRRPPFGPVAPTAHNMAREFHILEAVHPVFPLAPRPFLLCEDGTIIGSVFYVMERRHGRVVRFKEPPELFNQPKARRRLSEAMVDALAELHLVDVSAPPLSALGKPAGFVERQVRGWSDRWRRSRTTDLPEMDMLATWLGEHMPDDPKRSTLVHGDYKLDNVMLAAEDLGRIVGVFDWEMSALGDPLVDLGILLGYWVHTATESREDALAAVTSGPGWFSRDEILARYGERTAFDLTGIVFYEVFALFKLAVVLQQIFFRYYRGQTDDPRFAGLDERVTWLARLGAALVE